MKKLLLVLLFLLVKLSYGQTHYYTFNNDSIYTEKMVRSVYQSAMKNLPDSYLIKPTIYHRIISNDSIVNYLSFVAQKKEVPNKKNKFEFTMKQDSVFLLLNKKLPAFKLKDLNGKEFTSDQLTGKPALLNYWAIYCDPCIAEIPELNTLKNQYGDKMNFIGLTENNWEDDGLVKFLEKNPFNYYILQDAGNYKRDLKIKAIPRSIFIDSEGFVRHIQGNFPLSYDPKTGKKISDDNNHFVKIIEKLVQTNDSHL